MATPNLLYGALAGDFVGSIMETRKHTKKILNQIENSLGKGPPITSSSNIVKSKEIHDECHTLAGIPLPPCPEEELCRPEMKTSDVIEINVMSLHRRRFTTPGMFMPPPLRIETADYNVREGDTWENLAARTACDLEILLRVNGVPVEEVYET